MSKSRNIALKWLLKCEITIQAYTSPMKNWLCPLGNALCWNLWMSTIDIRFLQIRRLFYQTLFARNFSDKHVPIMRSTIKNHFVKKNRDNWGCMWITKWTLKVTNAHPLPKMDLKSNKRTPSSKDRCLLHNIPHDFNTIFGVLGL